MSTTTEYIYDTKFHRRYKLEYDRDTKEIKSINKKDYKNTLYFYENYVSMHSNEDIIWITDDNHIVEMNHGVFNLSHNIDFFKTLRLLKTREKIVNYTKYLLL
jgi:hypothetical protein